MVVLRCLAFFGVQYRRMHGIADVAQTNAYGEWRNEMTKLLATTLTALLAATTACTDADPTEARACAEFDDSDYEDTGMRCTADMTGVVPDGTPFITVRGGDPSMPAQPMAGTNLWDVPAFTWGEDGDRRGVAVSLGNGQCQWVRCQ